MVTEKLKKMHQLANVQGITRMEAKEISHAFFEEMFTKCDITREEFSIYGNGITLSAKDLWDLITFVSINERKET